MDCSFFLSIYNKLYTLNKSFIIIVEKLGCQNCVIVHIGNVNHDMALNQTRKNKMNKTNYKKDLSFETWMFNCHY